MKTFEEYWAEVWTPSNAPIAFDKAFREVAERAWIAGQNEILENIRHHKDINKDRVGY